MIPQFDQIRIQALKTLKSGAVMRAKDFRVPLAEHFHLTDEEMNAWCDKGLSMLESCSDEQISEYIKTTVNARTPKKESKIKDTLEEASDSRKFI